MEDCTFLMRAEPTTLAAVFGQAINSSPVSRSIGYRFVCRVPEDLSASKISAAEACETSTCTSDSWVDLYLTCKKKAIWGFLFDIWGILTNNWQPNSSRTEAGGPHLNTCRLRKDCAFLRLGAAPTTEQFHCVEARNWFCSGQPMNWPVLDEATSPSLVLRPD